MQIIDCPASPEKLGDAETLKILDAKGIYEYK